eukprot:CAMPEP_0114320984 /NCGR_PEP_ID=MMETSP0059-20121206/26294_1 /TAXON_ID=36894 /ORGANISM="Pyramimonas parkeae, Strain CCMP726" /LENGTH=339 /DNA_ID=CAMNT_0001448551 /DNA_START=138 /DNA_END=1160 /DNA_ORIENTATION=-
MGTSVYGGHLEAAQRTLREWKIQTQQKRGGLPAHRALRHSSSMNLEWVGCTAETAPDLADPAHIADRIALLQFSARNVTNNMLPHQKKKHKVMDLARSYTMDDPRRRPVTQPTRARRPIHDQADPYSPALIRAQPYTASLRRPLSCVVSAGGSDSTPGPLPARPAWRTHLASSLPRPRPQPQEAPAAPRLAHSLSTSLGASHASELPSIAGWGGRPPANARKAVVARALYRQQKVKSCVQELESEKFQRIHTFKPTKPRPVPNFKKHHQNMVIRNLRSSDNPFPGWAQTIDRMKSAQQARASAREWRLRFQIWGDRGGVGSFTKAERVLGERITSLDYN